MKTLRVLLALSIALVGPSKANAQDWFWGLTYQVSGGVGDTKDFVDGKVNFRNIAVDGRKLLSRNASAGMHFGWNVITSQDDKVVTLNNTTITGGAQVRYVNAFPIYANAHYYFGRRNGVRPAWPRSART